jgi:beta-lactam-binding protein with PASTA domain
MGEPGASEQDSRMPDLRGKTKRQALALLAPLGVRVSFTGRGIVKSQFPPAGFSIPAGTACRLNCETPRSGVAGPGQQGSS